MKKLVLICLCFHLSGCTLPLACVLYNNTGNDFLLVILNEDRVTQKTQVKKDSFIQIENWELRNYRIIIGTSTKEYAPEFVNQDFIPDSGWGPWSKRKSYAQIEPDGRVFVLNIKQVPPVIDFPDQPRGFPVIPNQ